MLSQHNKPSIVFTGGNTGGHVVPNLPLIHKFKDLNWNIFYIGDKNGVEADIIPLLNVQFYSISVGKLRRYFDFRNITDILWIIKGIIDSIFIIRKLRPNIIFSKGGFVAVPVVIAGWIMRIPIIAHESDVTFGLTDKISFILAEKLCCGLPITKEIYKNKKIIFTGIPLRQEIKGASREKGLKLLGQPSKKPILLILGGSIGAQKINDIVIKTLHQLLEEFHVVHICGHNNIDKSLIHISNYQQFPYIHNGFFDVVAASEFVVSRAGATILYELAALQKPTLAIPLSKSASRGDQIANAEYFKKLKLIEILYEEDLNIKNFIDSLKRVYSYREAMREAASRSFFTHINSAETIKDIILSVYKQNL